MPTHWTQRLHFGPPPRINHSMAYDAARQRMVVFGGVDGNGSSLGDTWVWDGSYWTQVAETGPSAREGHSTAYDAVHQEIALFGGNDGATQFADTWTWDGVSWTQVAETGPAARTDHAAAYDEARKVVTLFGGWDQVEFADTWEWDGTAWTQQQQTGPVARRNHTLAYDLASARVVLFGGLTALGTVDDTWTWNGVLWTQVAQFGPPSAEGGATAFDGRGLMLFGGVGAAGGGQAGRDDTWDWREPFWTRRLVFGPPGRTEHALAFDSVRRRIVLFGGARNSRPPLNAGALLGDTWEQPAADAGIASVVVSPATVPQGGTITITVALSGPATAAATVQLAASLADQPGSLALTPVTIPQAQVDATATVVVPAAAVTGDYTVSATLAGIVRTAPVSVTAGVALAPLHMVAAMPNPAGDELQLEEVHLRNDGLATIVLAGWRISNPAGTLFWLLDNADGIAPALQTTVVTRRGRPLTLTNNGGTILLLDPLGAVVETKTYGVAAEGVVVPLV